MFTRSLAFRAFYNSYNERDWSGSTHRIGLIVDRPFRRETPVGSW
jgi:hypothetical protein